MKTFSDRIKMALSGMLAVSLLASCSSQAVTETTQPAVPESVPSVESSVSESETTEEETFYTGLSVETEPHENPFGDFIFEDAYIGVAGDVLYNSFGKGNMYCGFDNSVIINLLQEEVYDKTGVLDTSLTLSDVNYFQGISLLKDFCDGGHPFSYRYTQNGDEEAFFKNYEIEVLRAVLSYLGLRFGIDEIPASFFQERFPRYFYDYFMYDGDTHAIQVGDIVLPEVEPKVLNDVEDPDFKDFLIFIICYGYNMWRLDCVYANPYGTGLMIQVRDEATGKNVLVPTDSQAEAMQEDINSIPGLENISIYVAETPEEFYASFGYYPADLLENVGPLNTKEGFEEYYNSLPEDEQNELYAPILFD